MVGLLKRQIRYFETQNNKIVELFVGWIKCPKCTYIIQRKTTKLTNNNLISVYTLIYNHNTFIYTNLIELNHEIINNLVFSWYISFNCFYNNFNVVHADKRERMVLVEY